MPTYVDGYLLPVPTRNLEKYRAMAARAAKIWKKHGALSYCEAAAEDMSAKFCPPFTKLLKPKRGETLIFAFVTYKSRAHRDKVNAAVMADPELMAGCDPKNMPFDCTRMFYGGFSAIVEARQ
ncbi:MAG: DUF1428 domain-containing protein [Opitutae bacterium]|nr:DUF1428 domain-containing protein [Opitutae bacterium]